MNYILVPKSTFRKYEEADDHAGLRRTPLYHEQKTAAGQIAQRVREGLGSALPAAHADALASPPLALGPLADMAGDAVQVGYPRSGRTARRTPGTGRIRNEVPIRSPRRPL